MEHPFSRPRRCRSGILRINVPRNLRFLVCERIAQRFVNACGDCAPCGYTCICKARHRNRKPHPQRSHASGGVGWGSSQQIRTVPSVAEWFHPARVRVVGGWYIEPWLSADTIPTTASLPVTSTTQHAKIEVNIDGTV